MPRPGLAGTPNGVPGRVGSVAVAVVPPDPFTRIESGRSCVDTRPVDDAVRLMRSGVDGDTMCASPTTGGPDQAVYADDLAFWAAELDRPVTTVGQNLTLSDVDCSGAVVGKRWRVGDADLLVRAPRLPCCGVVGMVEMAWRGCPSAKSSNSRTMRHRAAPRTSLRCRLRRIHTDPLTPILPGVVARADTAPEGPTGASAGHRGAARAGPGPGATRARDAVPRNRIQVSSSPPEGPMNRTPTRSHSRPNRSTPAT